MCVKINVAIPSSVYYSNTYLVMYTLIHLSLTKYKNKYPRFFVSRYMDNINTHFGLSYILTAKPKRCKICHSNEGWSR